MDDPQGDTHKRAAERLSYVDHNINYLAESGLKVFRLRRAASRGKQDLGACARPAFDNEFQFCRWWCGFSSVR